MINNFILPYVSMMLYVTFLYLLLMVLYDFYYNLLMQSSHKNNIMHVLQIQTSLCISMKWKMKMVMVLTSVPVLVALCDNSCCYAMLLMLAWIANSDKCPFLCCVLGVHVIFFALWLIQDGGKIMTYDITFYVSFY